MLAIIDYEMGNVKSIKNAFDLLGEKTVITDEKYVIEDAEAIVLPGVGAFSDGMKNLASKNLLSVLETEVIEKKKPYLGICLGLEFLAKKSRKISSISPKFPPARDHTNVHRQHRDLVIQYAR